jgi:alcohol dehydrogenase class IV
VRPFTYKAREANVTFGSGTLARLPEVADELGLKAILLLSSPQQEDQMGALCDLLGSRVAAQFGGAAMHTPVEVTEQAMEVVRSARIDGTIALGGGSTIGLGKAIALRTGLPQIAIPTTYAGSEMTPIIGQTEGQRKTTQSAPQVLPKAVIYDVDLTMSLPLEMSVSSGFNAMAHSVEGLYARDGNPVMELLAADAIRALSGALPRIAKKPLDKAARGDALYGAWLSGTVLGNVGMALHHKLCHVLGGLGLPHAETHAILLPHAVTYNSPAIPDAMARMEQALDTHDPARRLFDLGQELGLPRGLRAIGLDEDSIERVADETVANPYWNPQALVKDELMAMLRRAWAGDPPGRS